MNMIVSQNALHDPEIQGQPGLGAARHIFDVGRPFQWHSDRVAGRGESRLLTALLIIQQEDTDNFYNNIYTGQRPPASWQCHMCTFRNHPLLDKCEQCDMPRVFVGTSPSRTYDSGFGSFRDKTKNKPDQTLSDTVTNLPSSVPK
ncbi:hypothetical protein MSG28_013376 [Choristoneura fumiferana]|uniref:Uncharacterized protein n=1 Tax=Choristoneura fumiferana TaxID=7141 RepID=A0ACC0KU06_CHOFU|nr:hypothetical protein MSG28_013376 [Choristoneura fumiferana]